MVLVVHQVELRLQAVLLAVLVLHPVHWALAVMVMDALAAAAVAAAACMAAAVVTATVVVAVQATTMHLETLINQLLKVSVLVTVKSQSNTKL